jgi:hypothetical protein
MKSSLLFMVVHTDTTALQDCISNMMCRQLQLGRLRTYRQITHQYSFLFQTIYAGRWLSRIAEDHNKPQTSDLTASRIRHLQFRVKVLTATLLCFICSLIQGVCKMFGQTSEFPTIQHGKTFKSIYVRKQFSRHSPHVRPTSIL